MVLMTPSFRRTVSVDALLLLPITTPDQRPETAFSAFTWAGASFASPWLEPDCATTGIDTQRTNTDVKSKVTRFFIRNLRPSLEKIVVRAQRIDPRVEKNKPCSKRSKRHIYIQLVPADRTLPTSGKRTRLPN